MAPSPVLAMNGAGEHLVAWLDLCAKNHAVGMDGEKDVGSHQVLRLPL